ncbi:MAG TPA: hypothetical protein VKR82_01335 [Candidatus Acidoferrales bacterium]|nr:hypothetical protein [Candidatus Acidoferrales bacterium]
MAMELTLIPRGTRVESNGDGETLDISGSTTRTFFCTLEVFDQIEQESLDVSVWGSTDGQAWGAHPIIKLPQVFYRGNEHMILDLTMRPELRFVRAHWDLVRWGRVAPLPMFVMGLQASEIPAMPVARSTAGVVTAH